MLEYKIYFNIRNIVNYQKIWKIAPNVIYFAKEIGTKQVWREKI